MEWKHGRQYSHSSVDAILRGWIGRSAELQQWQYGNFRREVVHDSIRDRHLQSGLYAANSMHHPSFNVDYHLRKSLGKL
jgi:hypothetical protein